ncbi:MAG: hypothetical protein J5966_07110 [Lachnospiraceae bacterium]|nr:hypothetical protein [Lachnospiraceae bacterium]
MKIYNIRRSKDFFKKLADCKGEVQIVGEDGKAVRCVGSTEAFLQSELSCFDGVIPQIEVKFQRPEDLDGMLNFIMNERRSA